MLHASGPREDGPFRSEQWLFALELHLFSHVRHRAIFPES
jgi:hypothetical protein